MTADDEHELERRAGDGDRLAEASRCRQYEARCRCGSRWRVYRAATEDDDDPRATCISCGEDTYDLTDNGVARA